MRVIVGNGKVANILKKDGDTVLSHSDIEVTEQESVDAALKQFPPGTVIINTTGKINLEWCEENPIEAYDVNTNGARQVAITCNKLNLKMVHISSGCIFDGMETEHVFTEEDVPSPSAWYTKTKARADELVEEACSNSLIIRPRQLISHVANPTNMLTKFMNIKSGSFISSKNSITCIEDMALAIDHLLDGGHTGIFNVANTGWLSPLNIAVALNDKFSLGMHINSVSYQDYLKQIKVKRVNTLLSVDKLISTGFTPRSAQEALDWCIDNYMEHA